MKQEDNALGVHNRAISSTAINILHPGGSVGELPVHRGKATVVF